MSRVYKITVREEPTSGGLARDFSTEGAFSVRRRRYVLFVHGYSVSDPQAEAEYEHVANLFLKIAPSLRGQMGMFLWPGDEHFFFTSKWAYPKQVENARDSAPMFARYLQSLFDPADGFPQIVIIAHSLGSRVVLEALDYVQPIARRRRIQAFLTAAAYPVKNVPSLSAPKDTSVSVFHSRTDLALRAFRYLENSEAVGLRGQPRDVWDNSTEMKNYGHGSYSRSAEVHAMICRAIGFSVPRSLAARSLTSRFPVPNRSLGARRSIPTRGTASKAP